MKNKKITLMTIALLTTLMGGCSLFQGGEEATTPQTEAPTATQTPPPTPNPTFTEPPKPSVSSAAVLTPATDPDQRVTVVTTGSANPFVLLPKPQVKPNPDAVIEEKTNATNVPTMTAPPTNNAPGAGGNNTTSTNPSATANNGGLAKVITTPNPNLPNDNIPILGDGTPKLPPLVFTPQLPALPEPTLARGVQVTGLITIGSQTKIILKAPNEPFSRYVQAGEYISDGQVLVKRIEGTQRGTPVVILEQFGIEVSKRVEAPTGDATVENAPTPPAPPAV